MHHGYVILIKFSFVDTKESPSLHCTAPTTWLMDLLLIVYIAFFWVSQRCYLSFGSMKLIEVMLITYQQRYVDATVLLKIECDKNMQLDTCNDHLLECVYLILFRESPKKWTT